MFQPGPYRIILAGGRDSGKSTAIYQAAATIANSVLDHDIMACRDTKEGLADSTFAGIRDAIADLGFGDLWRAYTHPAKLVRKDGRGVIYFEGIGGDYNRTKSFKTSHPLSLLLYDELQQTRSQDNLEQAESSFLRLFKKGDPANFREIYAFNPPKQRSAWVNEWAEIRASSSDYTTIRTTYRDISHWLSDMDLRNIFLMKNTDRTGYEWMYEGKPVGGLGMVYPMFDASATITPSEFRRRFGGMRILGVIVGCDGAVNRDKTVFAPGLVMENGQMVIWRRFVHNPKIDGVISSAEMMERARPWFDSLVREFGLRDPANMVPIAFEVDSAATDLILELAKNYGNAFTGVEGYRKQTIAEMVATMQSAIAKHAVLVMTEGKQRDYTTGKDMPGDPLVLELQSLAWKETPQGISLPTYDPVIPNDASDAMTYGVNAFFRNPMRLAWLEPARVKMIGSYYGG